ncbi:DUF6421 family protein [Streptomyces sp. DSM 116496]|uniref:DUF6421 family protein n=1 Tax=Streptomyces stoeckheimensis TaxID=3344656 RepID=UPI0038B3B3EF
MERPVREGTQAALIVACPAWQSLKDAVESIGSWQSEDGAISFEEERGPTLEQARDAVTRVVGSIRRLSPLLPHDADYHLALIRDLTRWADNGFGKPDFLDSLLAFAPAEQRIDGLRHLVVFPMHTQNGNPHCNLEAVAFRVVWPEWIADLERTTYGNPLYLGIEFEGFTSGYDTHAAVLFPETVAVRENPGRFTWGAIFCDREAARLRTVTNAAVTATRLELPGAALSLLADPERMKEAFVLWDLIHDRTHSLGDLPFDPFMIKQRQPYWMYGIEELRCDLTAFQAGQDLIDDHVPQGRDVQYAILFDRLFRFPITGDRVRNYDGLGGQLLFAALHRAGAIRWSDNTLAVDWAATAEAVARLRTEIEDLYRLGIDRPKVVHWLKSHAFVSSYLSPHPASAWADGANTLDFTLPPRKLVDSALPDEFPLSMFYEALAKKLRHVIEATRGITTYEETRTAA